MTIENITEMRLDSFGDELWLFRPYPDNSGWAPYRKASVEEVAALQIKGEGEICEEK